MLAMLGQTELLAMYRTVGEVRQSMDKGVERMRRRGVGGVCIKVITHPCTTVATPSCRNVSTSGAQGVAPEKAWIVCQIEVSKTRISAGS